MSNRLAQRVCTRMSVTLFPSRTSFVPKRYLISAASYPVALVGHGLPFLIMPQQSSTLRRRRLADFLDRFGEAAMKKCSTCAKHGRVCKVHVRSGKCNECVRRGQRCDLQVSKSEFDRMLKEKEKLQSKIAEAQRAQDAADEALQKALEERQIARAREARLRQQMDLLDRRAAEAIAVEETCIEELEREEQGIMDLPLASSDGGFMLSPLTWGALEGFSDSVWDWPDPGGTVAAGPSSR